ncbi:hypothetical protein SEA_SIXAMA_49 [Gordonia phage Sixama]|uniref:Uncharacterized protein n=1 Tax=Gordonia phage Sixama TaxID=2653271 RepID=A0A5Q2F1T2_9CAUD|nr:hypothetical protein PP302_gp049 [Gordonia phage Sixama]QGF20228.1 hypothetical protein SEA_SIXAMA_49 [Gordonia phage Sixama]
MTTRTKPLKTTEANLNLNYVDMRVYTGSVENARKLNVDQSAPGQEIKQITPRHFELSFSSHFDANRIRQGRGFVYLTSAKVTEQHLTARRRYFTLNPGEHTRTYFETHDPQNKPPKWLQNAIYVAEDHIRSSLMLPTLTAKELRELIRSNGWHKDTKRYSTLADPGQVLFRGYTTADDSALVQNILDYWFSLPENRNHIRADIEYRRTIKYTPLWQKIAEVRKA